MSVERIKIPGSEPSIQDLSQLGLDPTPEMFEFVNQLAESAITGSPLAQPYIEAGAIRVFNKDIIPGHLGFQAVGFHNTKLAEMLKSPASHYN